MKPRALVFSYVDWLIVFGIIVSIVFLLIFPFQNDNNRAILYMAQKKYDKAEQKWREVLGKKSLFPFYRMNLALNYMLWEQPEKAIREHGVMKNLVEKINYPNEEEILFYNFFNSAMAATQKGDRKKALGFYQQALVSRAESLEVKTNIELLMRESESSSGKDEKQENSQGGEQKEQEGEGKGGENQSDKENQEGDQQNQEEGDESKRDSEQNQGKGDEKKEESEQSQEEGEQSKQESKESDKRNLNKTQTESILKAILEQEKKIRERRQKGQKRKPVVEKDW